MKKMILISIILLTGCAAESTNTAIVSKPSYLTVFQQFQKTPLYKQCDQFEENIRREPHEVHRILPSSVRSDMEIVRDSYSNGTYTATISCDVNAVYSFSSFSYITEDFSLNLGEFSFGY